ncbi:MAG: hypothetical protein IH624_10545 [Phycisphaerae bacterium]|nr:hypothetical protein [Phycisphaerae bacterium]
MARGAQWLDLTDGQQDKIKAIVKEAVADRAERRADIAAAIKDVLTEEQAKKIEALQSRRPMRGADRGQGIGRGQRPGWGQGPAQGFGPGQGRGRDFQRQNDQPRPGAWQGQGQGQGRGPGRGAGPRR